MKKFIVFTVLCLWLIPLTAQEAVITLWKDSAIGAIYNKKTETVAYGKKDVKGYYKIYLSDTLGNHEKPLTFPGWQSDRHQWAEEWHPSGEYLFCYVEKPEYVKEKGHKRKPVDATPGYGAYTDLWLISRDGTRAWKLLDLPNNYNSGIIHSAISDDGKLFAWSERIKAPKIGNFNLMAGSYVMRVADFVFDSVPRLENIRTFQPGNIDACNELDGISKDNTTISFYSTFETKNLFTTPIYTLNIITGDIKRLTFDSFAQAATYTPDGKQLVYMTGHHCAIFPLEIQGADWWIMNTDGTSKRRLSYMNVRNHPHSVNHYRLAGCLSFMSDNTFLGGVMTKPLGLTGYTAKVVFQNDKKIIPVEWVNDLKGDFSFKDEWSYPEGVYKNSFGQISCDGFCPPETDSMKDSTGKIKKDSLEAFYRYVDTSHYCHSIRCEALTYEYAGTNYIQVTKNEAGKVHLQTEGNAGTHCSLHLEISNEKCVSKIVLNSVTERSDSEIFYCNGGFIKIDKSLWEKGILKAEFSFTFDNPEGPEKEMFWKGKIYTNTRE